MLQLSLGTQPAAFMRLHFDRDSVIQAGLKDYLVATVELKGKPVVELSESKWLCDLAFVVDITKYLWAEPQAPHQVTLTTTMNNYKTIIQ